MCSQYKGYIPKHLPKIPQKIFQQKLLIYHYVKRILYLTLIHSVWKKNLLNYTDNAHYNL